MAVKSCRLPLAQHTTGEDLRAQPAVALQGFFGPFGKGLIHPVTGSAFLGAEEAHALHLKLFSDQAVQVHITGDEVSAKHGGGHSHRLKLLTHPLIDLMGKEGDLAFVVLFEVKKTIAHESLARDTLDRVHFDHGRLPCGLTVMAKEIVLGRNVEVEELHENVSTTFRSSAKSESMPLHPGMLCVRHESMNEDKIIRVGFVGAGGIVKQRHLPGLRALPNVRITAVANSSLGSAEAFCRDFAPEAKAIARWEDVVDNEEVDVVWIGAHPCMHHDATDFGLQCRKHVFTQARMAATLAEAERMWERAQSFPELVTAICPAPQGMKGGEMVKKLLAEGAIGTPHQAMVHSLNSAWLDANQPAHWRQRVEISGVQILTLGIYTEVLQRWLGHIVEVEARGRVVIPERQGYTVETPDFVHVMAKFRGGLEATMLFSGVAAHAPTDKLWLYGSEGTLSYDFVTDEVALGKREGSLQVVPVPTDMQREWTVERDFIQAVRDPSAPRPKPDFTEGVCYMRVVDAVWEALETRAAVKCA